MNKLLFSKSALPYLLARKSQFCSAVITPSQDLYHVLGIPRSSSQSDVKQAFYSLSLKYHPDKNKGNDEAAHKFREVSEAYEILGNAFLRQKYDMNIPLHTIRGHKPPGTVTVRELKYQQFFESRLTPIAYGDTRRKQRFDDEYFDSAQRYRKKPVTDRLFPDANDPERRMVSIMFFLLLFGYQIIWPDIYETAVAPGEKPSFFE